MPLGSGTLAGIPGPQPRPPGAGQNRRKHTFNTNSDHDLDPEQWIRPTPPLEAIPSLEGWQRTLATDGSLGKLFQIF